MPLTSDISNCEHDLIRSIAGNFPRHPQQVNKLLEADAEIIRIKDSPAGFLIIKTDGIHEEIRTKLYEDPFLIGWMALTAPVSDLAAVGVRPLGLLLSLVLPRHFDNQWLHEFNRGVNAACEKYETYILGGDTNVDEDFSVSATAVALSTSAPVTRKGLAPGNNIYTTGAMGQGNAFAYSRFFDNKLKFEYRPVARLDISNIISKYASACIDSSDGFFPALSVLSDINKVGFDISTPLVSLLSDDALKISRYADLPSWMMLAGPHGEYELIFSVHDNHVPEFEFSCKKQGWQPIYIGRSKKEKEIHFLSESTGIKCSPALIPNLFSECNGDLQGYFESLIRQQCAWSCS